MQSDAVSTASTRPAASLPALRSTDATDSTALSARASVFLCLIGVVGEATFHVDGELRLLVSSGKALLVFGRFLRPSAEASSSGCGSFPSGSPSTESACTTKCSVMPERKVYQLGEKKQEQHGLNEDLVVLLDTSVSPLPLPC